MSTDALQSLQGTPWQERLLFLQQNTEPYRWVAVGVIIGIYLISSIIICVLCRKKLSMNVCAMCFVPGVSLVMILWGILMSIFYSLSELFSSSSPKVKKVKSVSDDTEFNLGLDEEVDDDSIDLF